MQPSYPWVSIANPQESFGVLSVFLLFVFAFFFSSSEDGKETGKA